MKKLHLLLTVAVNVFFIQPGHCQRGAAPNTVGFFGAEKTVIKLDPLSNIPEKAFPFDRWFYVRRYYKAGSLPVKSVFVTQRVVYSQNGNPVPPLPIAVADFFEAKSDVTDEQPAFTEAIDILVPPLEPRSGYDLVFAYPMSFDRREQLANAFTALHLGRMAEAQQLINDINSEKVRARDYNKIAFSDFDMYYHFHVQSLLQTAVNSSTRATLIASLNDGGQLIPSTLGPPGSTKPLFLDMEILSVSGTQSFTLETRANALIQPDFGVAFYGIGGRGDVGINKDFVGVMPYVGISLLFRSFDADIPIRNIRKLAAYERLSVHAGITLLTLEKEGYRQNLFNSNNLMLGLGYRLTSVTKVQAGVLLYRKADPNPLYTTSKVAPIGYVALSVDLRIRNVLGDVGKFLFGPN